jgi:hypothetical protein
MQAVHDEFVEHHVLDGRQAAALRWMDRVRTPARALLGIRERRTK